MIITNIYDKGQHALTVSCAILWKSERGSAYAPHSEAKQSLPKDGEQEAQRFTKDATAMEYLRTSSRRTFPAFRLPSESARGSRRKQLFPFLREDARPPPEVKLSERSSLHSESARGEA